MPFKIYLDENVASKELARLLRKCPFEVVTPVEAGLIGQDDAAHMAYAKRRGLVLLTKNPADFLELHRKDSAHAGIIGVYQDNHVKKDMSHQEIVAALSRLTEEGFNFGGKFIVLNHYRTKRRMR